MNTKPKSALLSITIWGAIIAALPALLNLFGIPWPDGLDQDLKTMADAVLTVLGSLMAILGRFRASRPVTLTVPPQVAPAWLLALLLLPVLCGGCGTAAGFGRTPKKADLWLQGIKAKEMTATISSPAFNISIQATDFDSRTEATGLVNAAPPSGPAPAPTDGAPPAPAKSDPDPR